MVLSVQLISLLVSFCYGIFFFLMLEINTKLLFSSNLLVKLLFSFLFVLVHALLYFIILVKINFGYIHIYFFLALLGGYLICKVIFKRFVKNVKL